MVQRCDRCPVGRSNRWYRALTLHPPIILAHVSLGGGGASSDLAARTQCDFKFSCSFIRCRILLTFSL